MQSRVTNEFFKALPLALAISLALWALILWPLGVWGQPPVKLTLWEKIINAPRDSVLWADENGEFQIVTPKQMMEQLKLLERLKRESIISYLPGAESSGVTTEWLPGTLTLDIYRNSELEQSVILHGYQLGLRSDGVVVWREAE